MQAHHSSHGDKRAYQRLGVELIIEFAIMYLVMYSMIASLRHFRFNIGNAYMTMMMVAPMAVVMLISMRAMFPSPRLNRVAYVAALAVFVLGWFGMRRQLGVGDAQFLRSMIPHHSGAVLMCEQASLTDPEIIELCREIVESQEREIAQMEAILERY